MITFRRKTQDVQRDLLHSLRVSFPLDTLFQVQECSAATLPAGTLGSAPGLRCPAKGRWFLWPREGDPGLRGRRSRRLAALRTADSSEPAWVSFFSRSPSSRGLISRFPMPVTQGARPWAASRLAPTPHSPPRGTLGVAHLSLEGLGVFSGALSPQRIL